MISGTEVPVHGVLCVSADNLKFEEDCCMRDRSRESRLHSIHGMLNWISNTTMSLSEDFSKDTGVKGLYRLDAKSDSS